MTLNSRKCIKLYDDKISNTKESTICHECFDYETFLYFFVTVIIFHIIQLHTRQEKRTFKDSIFKINKCQSWERVTLR